MNVDIEPRCRSRSGTDTDTEPRQLRRDVLPDDRYQAEASHGSRPTGYGIRHRLGTDGVVVAAADVADATGKAGRAEASEPDLPGDGRWVVERVVDRCSVTCRPVSAAFS